MARTPSTTCLAALLAALLFSASVSAAAPAKPLPALKAAAGRGAAADQLAYGKALATDRAQREEARAWLEKASAQGLGEATWYLGYAGIGKEKPVYYYEKAAEQGYGPAFMLALDALLFRAGPDADVAAAKKLADLARAKKVNIGFDTEALPTVDLCAAAGSAELPAGDKPSAEELNSLKNADCETYAVHDWAHFRKCQLASPAPDNNRVAEVYANGWGVARDGRLALALVCHGGTVPAELEGMAKFLASTRDQPALEKPFSACDYASSGDSVSQCAARASRVEQGKREGMYGAVTSKWSAPQKAAFARMRAAADNFIAERINSEIDLSGTMRGALQTAEEEKLRQGILQNLTEFEAGQLPTSTDLPAADAALNAAYHQALQKLAAPRGTVSQGGVKKTERKWIPYREAWAALGVLRYPAAPAEAWKAWATRARTQQLLEVAGP
jgi:uncharacterized protein YecT (DUF1311 family)